MHSNLKDLVYVERYELKTVFYVPSIIGEIAPVYVPPSLCCYKHERIPFTAMEKAQQALPV